MVLMKELLKKVFGPSIDLLYPPSCPVCKEITNDSTCLCRSCLEQLKFIRPPYCSCCGREFPGDGEIHLCGGCLQSPWAFHSARAFFQYEDVIAGLIHRLKYAGDFSGLAVLAHICRKSPLLPIMERYDYLLPVPLHLKRLRQRGFNQSLVLAKTIFPTEKEKIRFDLLIRQTETSSQAGLNGAERKRNVKGAFTVTYPSKVNGLNLLLFDDVFTTGTTVNECSKVLMAAGAGNVDVLTICRADRFLG